MKWYTLLRCLRKGRNQSNELSPIAHILVPLSWWREYRISGSPNGEELCVFLELLNTFESWSFWKECVQYQNLTEAQQLTIRSCHWLNDAACGVAHRRVLELKHIACRSSCFSQPSICPSGIAYHSSERRIRTSGFWRRPGCCRYRHYGVFHCMSPRGPPFSITMPDCDRNTVGALGLCEMTVDGNFPDSGNMCASLFSGRKGNCNASLIYSGE